ncbi:MAG: DNA repair protein RecO [Candidatus Yanofskybacteria bacterium RIFCSPHIGHO2_02_FULL_41_11]|uniref:DNA repair protein RecO n=1 Tax=Candidatus Yanofskybacteria bacterium RIFCSPHIGHO2_02_FULL_41_11 TaxID=1802675 RepID=A0A1F8FAS8_9BACT|nr:MAG: DNA repair protein RecO [Candidatus Yanofskybacteria bacterium RIFCSPHIGHO2_02_FULL_41_11]
MKTRAIILKKQNTGEYDQLVTCYTQELGKAMTIAKSILKKNSIQAMHLDLFNLVEFELINGNHLPIVTGAQAEKTYPNLKKSLGSLGVAYAIADYIDKIVFEYSKDDEMWNLLVKMLNDLDLGKQPLPVLKETQAKLLSVMGYQPDASVDRFFEHIAGRRFNSLSFAYSVLKLKE